MRSRKNKQTETYHPPKWLRGGHAQTIFPFLSQIFGVRRYDRQTIDTPDGDIIHLDWLKKKPVSPLVVLLHGLEGSSNSHYARALMTNVERLGWNGCVVHFRGCSGSPNHLPRAYHSGDSDELEWLIPKIKQVAEGPIFIAGFSLGGNVLLNWLGKAQYEETRCITAAASISAPYDLTTAGNRLSTGFNRVYGNHFLRTLKTKAIQKIQTHHLTLSVKTIRECATLKDFDNNFTAPVHGFYNVDDYWSRASSKPFLPNIDKPTLILHAKNDPFLPGGELTELIETNNKINLSLTATGGHVGYMRGPFPGNLAWLPNQITDYFKDFL